MGSRIGRVLLIAAAILIVVGGGAAAALLASSGDGDESVQLGGESSTGPADDPAGEPTTEVEIPTTTDAPAQPEQKNPPAQEGETGAPRKTTFPRERQESAQDDPPQRVFTVPPAREFSGTGDARLGTVNLKEPAVVKWTTRGSFELRFGREAFPIIAPSPSGQLVVPPYNFEFVRVIAKGRWTIRITPQR